MYCEICQLYLVEYDYLLYQELNMDVKLSVEINHWKTHNIR